MCARHGETLRPAGRSTLVDDADERTIITLGPRLEPMGERRGSAVGGAGGDGRRVLHRRRSRCAARRACGAGAGGEPARGRGARSGRRAGCAGAQWGRCDRASPGRARAGGGRAGRVHRGRARRHLSRALRRIGQMDGCAAAWPRRWTHTAAATPSRRGSPTRWARAWSCRPRWRWPRAAARSASPVAGHTSGS